MSAPRVGVVGGGISGLAAAYRLRVLLGPDAGIVLVEQSERLGGALRTVPLAGVDTDVGAEAFLVRRPEATALVHELGLADELVHPTSAQPTVRAGGRTVPLPPGTLLGLPTSAQSAAGVLSPAGLRRLAAEPARALAWEPGQDVAVGELVRRRAGDEVVDRLLDPLLGGVYAGRADRLGLRATMPALAAELDGGAGSLLAAARAALPAAPAPGPVFGTLRGGLTRLVTALVEAARPELHLGVPVRALRRRERGWRLELGSATDPAACDVDAVVLAVPAPGLRRLLADAVPAAGAAAAGIELASSVVVALALPEQAAAALPASSGVLVGSGEPLAAAAAAAKAFTYSARKWAHARGPGALLLRASLGRAGDPGAAAALRRDDAELIGAVRSDLATLTGITAEPVDAVVTRWGGGLPQYGVGHVGRIAELERAVQAVPGLAVAGAALHGVGIPACVATADAAALRVAAHLAPIRTDHRCHHGDMARLDYAELNSTIRYTMWSVFRVEPGRLPDDRADAGREAAEYLEALAGKGVVVRGVYDLAGLRADADWMVWWHCDETHGEQVEPLQGAYAELRRGTALGRASAPVWSSVALHRPAEFNKSHVPAFLAGEEPRRYVCVYPFVRSYDWYLLPDAERRAMLAEHGQQARDYPDVRANTVASFALGDYEWILAFEADELHRIVDLMRALRASQARRHVREEVPFFTGPRVPVAELITALP